MDTYDNLCNLIVLEQFKNSVPHHIAVHINESKVKTAAAAAVLADEYMLTRASGSQGCWGVMGHRKDEVKSSPGKFVGAHQGSQASVRSVPGTDGKFDPSGCAIHVRTGAIGKENVQFSILVRRSRSHVCM